MTQENTFRPRILKSCLALRAAVTLHYVETDVPRKKMPRPDEGNCFRSFQMDLLSRPSQMHPPMYSLQLRHIPGVSICMPASDVTCEAAPYHIKRHKVDADAYVSCTIFPASRIRIWHLTFVSHENSLFYDHDIIKFAKLHTGKEEDFRFTPENVMIVEQQPADGGNRPPCCIGSFLKSLPDLDLDLGLPRAGTVLIDTKHGLEDVYSGVRNLAKTIKPGAEDNIKGMKAFCGIRMKAFCGIVQGIHDYGNIEPAEMQDLLLPSVQWFPDYLRCHRGLLTRLEPESRWFRSDNNIGTCPYLLVVQAAVLHNEEIVARAEEKLESSRCRQRSIRRTLRKREIMELSQDLDKCLPDIFEYRAVRSLHRTVLRSRRLPGRYRTVRARIQNLQADAQIESTLQIQFLVGVLSVLAVFYPLRAAWDDSGTSLGKRVFWAVFIVLAAALTAVLWAIHRRLSAKGQHGLKALPQGEHE